MKLIFEIKNMKFFITKVSDMLIELHDENFHLATFNFYDLSIISYKLNSIANINNNGYSMTKIVELINSGYYNSSYITQIDKCSFNINVVFDNMQKKILTNLSYSDTIISENMSWFDIKTLSNFINSLLNSWCSMQFSIELLSEFKSFEVSQTTKRHTKKTENLDNTDLINTVTQSAVSMETETVEKIASTTVSNSTETQKFETNNNILENIDDANKTEVNISDNDLFNGLDGFENDNLDVPDSQDANVEMNNTNSVSTENKPSKNLNDELFNMF